MSVNQMNTEQAYGLMTAIYNQATGSNLAGINNLGEFVSVGTTLLQMDRDPLLRAINQAFSRTIVATRPYKETLRGMEVDNEAWGGIVRKLSFLDKEIAEYDDGYPRNPSLTADPNMIKDGVSVDMFIQNKPAVIQSNFYGGSTYADWMTFYNGQLRTAFSNAGEMAAFWAGAEENMLNKLAQMRENWKRIAIANMIGGRLASETDNNVDTNGTVVHLITEYKNATGNTTITSANWQSANEIKNFTRWLYGYLNTLVSYMGNRTSMFHTDYDYQASGMATRQGINATKVGSLMRQSAPQDIKVYLLTELVNQIDSQVFSSTYHNDMLRWVDYDKIDFFQSIQNPMGIEVTPTYINNVGTLVTPEEPITNDNVVGIIFDRDAMGISVFDEGVDATPWNARMRGYNQWFYETVRFWNDFTENSVVLVMD